MDLATNKFDMEPMKTTQSAESVTVFKKIIKRGILKLPEISLKTDGGPEFGKDFDKYLKDQSIFHKTSIAHRHTQMAPVERLNRSLSRIIMQYLYTEESKLGKTFNEWVPMLAKLIIQLNMV